MSPIGNKYNETPPKIQADYENRRIININDKVFIEGGAICICSKLF